MDALSNVLSMLRIRSAVSSRFEGRGGWAFSFPSYQHVKFGSVLEGQFYLWLDNADEPVLIRQGDFYLLTNGKPFRSASEVSRLPLDGPATYRSIRGNDGVVRYQAEGDQPLLSLASGRFIFENNIPEVLLMHLPALIHLRAADVASHALSRVLDLLRLETQDEHAGSQLAKGSLANLVLVHGLRAYLGSTMQPVGWLNALRDPKMGAALSLMHEKPGERWTLDSLASTVGMSRTAFAARFRLTVGTAPLEYLNGWRMTIARTALLHSEESLIDIAMRVGYLSDTSFSIAFKRRMGQSPGRFRQKSRESGAIE